MFFHPNGTVKKLVINMKEGKHMLKNKRVVKALTIGLATVLATPSMTAFAAAPGEVEPQAADDTVAAVAVDASAVTEVAPVEVKSDNRDEIDTAIKETKEALEAEKEANDAADDAVKNGLPQAGVVSLLQCCCCEFEV